MRLTPMHAHRLGWHLNRETPEHVPHVWWISWGVHFVWDVWDGVSRGIWR
jgi:hypothetical protein